MNEGRPRLRWWTVVLAVAWAVAIGGMAWGESGFAIMFAEMTEGGDGLPLATRVVVAIPAAGWIALGLAGAAAIVGKSFALRPKKSDLVDRIALVGLFVIMMAVAVALIQPISGLMDKLDA